MHLVTVVSTLLLIIPPFLSCDKRTELYPRQCDCDIEALHVSRPTLVTYQVFAYDDARISSITYQTGKGMVTVEPDSFPFAASVQLDKGDRVVLTAIGNPQRGSIVLGYEIQEEDIPTPRSSSTSRVWVLKDGACQ